jgi:hypothetical protein
LVERFITERALARALEGRFDFRLLLFETEAEGLLAVGAHHWRAYEVGQSTVDGTYLVVGAIGVPFQGAQLETRERLSDFLINALLSDARDRGRGDLGYRPGGQGERAKPRTLSAIWDRC